MCVCVCTSYCFNLRKWDMFLRKMCKRGGELRDYYIIKSLFIKQNGMFEKKIDLIRG